MALAIGVLTPIGGGVGTNFGGVHVGCHCWVPLLGVIAGVPSLGCHCWMLATNLGGVPLLGAIAGVPLLGAIAGCHCWGAIAGCHCWVPLLGAIAGVSLLGAIAGCHCWGAIAGVPLLGAIVRCHGWMPSLLDASGVHHAGAPLLGEIARKIDQSVTVTPFSAAPFSTVIAHKLACAIWGLCWYIFSISSICKYVECMRIIYTRISSVRNIMVILTFFG